MVALRLADERQAKDSELIQYATEIKVRAERRCGELLATAEKNQGGRPAENRSNDATGSAPTLADMGLTKSESSRYQQLAAMPSEHFETPASHEARGAPYSPLRLPRRATRRLYLSRLQAGPSHPSPAFADTQRLWVGSLDAGVMKHL